MFYPPDFSCLKCGRDLTRLSRVLVTVFSTYGAHDGYSTSLRCPVCPVRYYPQYYIDTEIQQRFYYSSALPINIHLEQHVYITASLAELFTMWTLFAWVSSLGSANIYNHAMSALPPEKIGQSRYTLTSEQVWRAFVLHALFCHASQYNTSFTMSEAPGIDHDLRLREVQSLRNTLMDRHGQPERLHACNVCEKLIPTDLPNAYLGLRPLHAVVVDGSPLANLVVKSIIARLPSSTIGLTTVPFTTRHIEIFVEPDHVAIEAHHKLKGKSFFMLRKRLLHANGVPDGNDEDADKVLELQPSSTHKSDLGNRQVKARFGRRRTHNEQLIVCSCGVIAARATMFGAEAISGVKLQGHLLASEESHFDNVILPVDVFHFKSKHKDGDFCNKHCNPTRWTELVGEDGKWVFNSSAAEQTNAWIGGYLVMVRDMLPHNYDFFLDEMIKRRNEVTIARLRQAGDHRYKVPPSNVVE
ncbi:hypothetical protein PQX77_002180 [Marasmius sp. AFHP31]|nr:hypothetical protein PQX77_002180 [Marasmius sp. AFHP31]